MSRIEKIWREKISETREWKNEGVVGRGGTVDNQTKVMVECAGVVSKSTLPEIEEHGVERRVNNIVTLLKSRSVVCDI
jgi:hypothetical protein